MSDNELRGWQRDLITPDADGHTLDQVIADLLGVKSVNLRTEQEDDGTVTSDDRRWRVQYFGGTYGGTLGECLSVARPAADDLGAAWAEAEAALPDGWFIEEVTRWFPGRGGGYAALALPPGGCDPLTVERNRGFGPTPATALRALAVLLRVAALPRNGAS